MSKRRRKRHVQVDAGEGITAMVRMCGPMTPELNDAWAEIARIIAQDTGRSPCFAPCGDDICKDHGCRHVYRSKPSVPQEQAQ